MGAQARTVHRVVNVASNVTLPLHSQGSAPPKDSRSNSFESYGAVQSTR